MEGTTRDPLHPAAAGSLEGVRWARPPRMDERIVQDVARILDTHFAILNASSPREIESAFATLVSEAGALVVTGENRQ